MYPYNLTYASSSEILNFIDYKMFDRLTRCHEIFILRLAVRLPRKDMTTPDSWRFRGFIRRFCLYLSIADLDPCYFWHRKSYTFHFCFLLSRSVARSFDKIVALARKLWAVELGIDIPDAGLLVDPCTQDYNGKPMQNNIMLKRNFGDLDWVFAMVDQWLRHFSRISRKIQYPGRCRLFGASCFS